MRKVRIPNGRETTMLSQGHKVEVVGSIDDVLLVRDIYGQMYFLCEVQPLVVIRNDDE